jgi:hypothetical protein
MKAKGEVAKEDSEEVGQNTALTRRGFLVEGCS